MGGYSSLTNCLKVGQTFSGINIFIYSIELMSYTLGTDFGLRQASVRGGFTDEDICFTVLWVPTAVWGLDHGAVESVREYIYRRFKPPTNHLHNAVLSSDDHQEYNSKSPCLLDADDLSHMNVYKLHCEVSILAKKQA